MALQSAIYLSSLGPSGLKEVAVAGVVMANELEKVFRDLILEIVTTGKFFNEFCIRLPKPPEQVRAELAAKGIHACVPVPAEYGLGHAGLFCATEITTHAHISSLKAALQEVIG